MNFVITLKMSYNYQIHACTMGFCKKPQVPLVMGVVDTGLLENTCLHSELMKKPQAPMPFYILHPVHHHMLVEVWSDTTYSISFPLRGVKLIFILFQYN